MAVAPLVVTLPRTAALAAPLVEVGVTTTLAIEIETTQITQITQRRPKQSTQPR